MPDPRRPLAAGLAVALALAASACAVRGPIGDKAGGVPGGKATLILATVSSQLQERPAVQYFIRRVEALSRGNVTIQVRYNWASPDPNAEQRVVKAVSAGTLDLGVVGSQTFDTMGVRSLRALNAPLLIDSYRLENAVLHSGIVKQMLAGLARLHVTDLGLLANGLRKPVAVVRPLLGPSDWRGIGFGTYLSRVQEEAIRALGAAPVVAFSALRNHLLAIGKLKGFEFNLLRYDVDSYWNQARYITANVNLWPQLDVLVMNPDRMAQLTSQQQSWLKQAARDAADRSVGLIATDETRVIPTICRLGARFAEASRTDLAWLRKSFAPVYSRLEQDRQTRSFISQIESLKRTTPPDPALAIPEGCLAASR